MGSKYLACCIRPMLLMPRCPRLELSSKTRDVWAGRGSGISGALLYMYLRSQSKDKKKII